MGWERMPPSRLMSIWSSQPSWPADAWTGQEALVVDVFDILMSGEIRRGSKAFDPATRQWRALRDPPTSDALWGSGFWAGKEMLIWRPSCNDPRQRGLAYDLETDDWRFLPPGPISDDGGEAVWVSGKMFVWGGSWREFGRCGNDAAFYDPVADSWASLPPAPISPRTASAVATDGKRFFVWGGKVSQFVAASDGAIHDPDEGDWRLTGEAPLPTRFEATAVWTGKEFIVWDGVHPTSKGGRRNRDGAAWDPSGSTWRRIAAAPTGRGGSVVWAGDEMLVYPAGREYEPGGACLGYRPEPDEWEWVPDNGATPTGPSVWTGTELYAWVANDPRHDLAVYRPEQVEGDQSLV